mmetsp:Transcript_31345/g.57361  ORF Transcript_31345/g.57361 Transcript_31345/m.57361 type:complete len:122 (+) Transcript_31345:2-367(+)
MEAEEAFCDDDIQSAEYFYEKASSSAREHRFIHEEALAHELAGHFFLEKGRKDAAVEHFMKAHEKYHEWGAVTKSNSLFEYARVLLSAKPSFGTCPFSAFSSSTSGSSDNGDKQKGKRMLL